MFILDASSCTFARIQHGCADDMQMWTKSSGRLQQLYLLSMLEATELVAHSPFFHTNLTTKIKWLEWHTSRRKSMTRTSSWNSPLPRKYSESTECLPAWFTWLHQDEWLLQNHLECRSYLYLLFYILHDLQYLPFFFFLLLTQCSSLLKTWQNLLKQH